MSQPAIPRNMKPYPVALLYPGPAYAALSDVSVPANQELHAAHLEAIRHEVEQGRQIMAVPILSQPSKLSAMAVYHPSVTVEQVTQILEADPAVRAGRFTFEVHTAFFPSLDSIRMEY